MATSPLARPLESTFLLRRLRGLYRRRLTARGRFVLWASVALAFVGVDTRRALVFVLFSLAAPPLLVGLRLLFRGRPAVRLSGRLPARLTAGRSVTASVDVALESGARGPLALFWAAPAAAYVGPGAGIAIIVVGAVVESAGVLLWVKQRKAARKE